MESQLAHGIAVAALSIVSGYVPYLAYKEITTISKVIEQYGSRNDMKLFTVHQIFKAQGGGIAFFFGCYIIAVGFASALFLENWKCYFSKFLLVGGIVAVGGGVAVAAGGGGSSSSSSTGSSSSGGGSSGGTVPVSW